MDDACTNGTVELYRRLGVDVVRLEARVSYAAAAINAGLRETDGDLLRLNADTACWTTASWTPRQDRGRRGPLDLRPAVGHRVP